MDTDAMKRALVLLFLVASPVLAEGPVFQHKDTIDQQEFENAYNDIRRFGNAATQNSAAVVKLVKVSTATNLTCIDSPTLCVDTANHRVGVGTASPATSFTVSVATFSINTSGQVLASNGTSALPAFSFSNDSDTGLYRTTSNEIRVANGGSATWTFDGAAGLNAQGSGAHIYNSSGTAGAPAYSFSADSDSGMYDADNNELAFATGGILKFHVSGGGHVYPEADNSYQCGISGHRWSQIWSANGTIQTSSSKLKAQIREIVTKDKTTTLVPLTAADIATTTFTAADNPEDVQVPRGIVFKWRTPSSTATANADMIGFLGDDLPMEAHALRPDGTRDPENFYTSAVVGLLCAKVRQEDARIAALEAAILSFNKAK